jgi:dihydrofolate reductase
MKTILYMASTIDGYIARENGDCPWSDIVWKEYYNFIKEKGNIIVGRKTYEIMKEVKEFEKLNNPLTVVLTHRDVPNEDKTYFVHSPEEVILLLKDQGFSEIVMAGGASLSTGFLRSKLIDEIHLFVESKIFGKGIKFTEGDLQEIDLELISVEKLSDTVSKSIYKVK